MDNQKFQFEEVTWKQVKKEVLKANPKLAKIIEESKPSSQHTFIKVRYPFGVNIRQNSKLNLPLSNGEMLPFDHPKIPKSVQQKLSYSSSPLGLILNKSVEVYVQTSKKRSVPFKIFKAGTIFGVWEIMEAPKVAVRSLWEWNISSGAKTIFMLPKISDTVGHAKLKNQLHIASFAPDTIYDHHKIFTEIAKSQYLKDPWDTEVLFFTENWIKPQENNIGWIKLREYWMKEAWHQLLHWANKAVFDFNWETYSTELKRRKIKLNNYLLETIKHLISIACGTIPGFSATNNNEVAPIQLLQNAYINIYGLKQYAPIILCPQFLSLDCPEKPIYYSLQTPSLPGKLAEHTEFSSAMKVLRDIKNMMDIFLELSNKWPYTYTVGNSFDFNEVIQIDYFHNEKDKYGHISSILLLLQEDPLLMQVLLDDMKKKSFPKTTQFFRGCIRLKFK